MGGEISGILVEYGLKAHICTENDALLVTGSNAQPDAQLLIEKKMDPKVRLAL